MPNPKIGFVGAGRMAQALAAGFVAAKTASAKDIFAADPSAHARAGFLQAVAGASVLDDNRQLADAADVIFLAVKPQFAQAAIAEVAPAASDDKLFISIIAGVTLATLRKWLPAGRLIRVMPNTPCLVRAGAAGYAIDASTTDSDAALAARLLSSVGLAIEVNENLLDAVTGLSGSGPAFVFVLIEAMADGGVRMGLPRAEAQQLAAQTFLGAAKMVVESGRHPAELKDAVASPGGTTIAGLQALEDRGARSAMIAAVEAAARRSRELGDA